MRLLLFLLILTACQPAPSKEAAPERVAPDSPELPTDINRVYQSQNGAYWFASRSKGLLLYQGDSLIHYTVEDGLPQDQILSIDEDKQGRIYFNTQSNPYRWDGATFEMLSIVDKPGENWQLDPDDIWIAGDWSANGVYRYSSDTIYNLRFEEHPLEQEFKALNPGTTVNPYAIYTTYKDSKGHIWIGTSTLGACRYDGTSQVWVSEREMTEVDGGPSQGVRGIVEDKDGNFWFGSNMSHKYRMIGDDETADLSTLPYEKLPGIDFSQLPGMSSSFISITQDAAGSIWMLQYQGGAWRWDGQQLKHYPIQRDGEEVDGFSLYLDRQDQLWVGTQSSGIYRLVGDSFEVFELDAIGR